MPREAIVEIAAVGKGLLGARLLQSTVEYPDALDYIALDLGALPKLDTCANVGAYGSALQKALAAHGAIANELKQISLTQAPDTALLQFLIAQPEGERLRWETLCMAPPDQFLALNGVCTVSRIAHTAAPTDPGIRTFTFPLRMAAFLSAARIEAEGEFNEVCARVGDAKAKGLDIACTVYLGEQELLDAALKAVEAKQLPGIQVAPIPADRQEIENTLKEHPVEFLHFFCHGVTDAGVRLLELATVNDHDTERASGSIPFSIERLTQVLLATGTTWITVLNSCSGGRPVEQLHSMALTLAKSASPFVVGMAEVVEIEDATIVTRAFYSELFDIVRARVGKLADGETVTLNLAPAVIRARRALHSQYETAPSDAYGRWSIPLMYRRHVPLHVLRRSDLDPDTKRRIELVAGALRSLPEDAPLELRQQILATLDKAGVPAARRPNVFGVLPTA